MSTFTSSFVALPLALAAFTFAPAADNDTNPPGVNPPGMGTTTQATAINTIDPVNGRPVDRSVETLRVSSKGKTMHPGASGVTGDFVVIGFSEKSSREKIEKAQGKEKEMYISAAQQNRMVKDGRMSDGDMNDRKHDGKAIRDGDRLQKDPADRTNPANPGDRTSPGNRAHPIDPANPPGPNQRGDGLDDASGANPGTEMNPRPADHNQPKR